MKKILLILAAASIGTSLFAYDIDSNSIVKGPVKSVTKTQYEISSKFGEYFRTPDLRIINKYDENGKVYESTEVTGKDSLINKVSYEYDLDGNLVETKCFDSDNIQIWNTKYTYKNGLPADSSEYVKGDQLIGRTIYTYTDSKLTDESYYNGEGAIVYKILKKYNKNQLEVEDEYFGDGSLSEERRYTYTADGNIDLITYIDGTGHLSKKDVFRYNNSVLSEVITYSAENRPVNRNVVKFDEKGNPVKITYYNVVRKFGSTVNEIADMMEISYEY